MGLPGSLALHCAALKNAVQCDAKPGRPILKPVGGHFPIYLGLGVYGHGVCEPSLHERQISNFNVCYAAIEQIPVLLCRRQILRAQATRRHRSTGICSIAA